MSLLTYNGTLFLFLMNTVLNSYIGQSAFEADIGGDFSFYEMDLNVFTEIV